MLNKERPPAVNLEEGPIYGTELGDIGIILVAAGISIVFLLIALFPPPFARMEQEQARQEKIQAQQAKIARQKEIAKAVASGEVAVSIYPSKHP
jgi:type II secretory pathway component PulM